MDDRIQSLEKKIESLELEIKRLCQICSRMDSHITFVETTYDKFKYPLNVIKGKVEGLFGSKSIKDKEGDELD